VIAVDEGDRDKVRGKIFMQDFFVNEFQKFLNNFPLQRFNFITSKYLIKISTKFNKSNFLSSISAETLQRNKKVPGTV
jgi:hypothetical protein